MVEGTQRNDDGDDDDDDYDGDGDGGRRKGVALVTAGAKRGA